MNQSEIIKRTAAICEEFGKRMETVGLQVARLELAKALAESEHRLQRMRESLEGLRKALEG